MGNASRRDQLIGIRVISRCKDTMCWCRMFLRSPLIKFRVVVALYTRSLLKRRKSRVDNFHSLNFYYRRVTAYGDGARIPVVAITAADLRGHNPFRLFVGELIFFFLQRALVLFSIQPWLRGVARARKKNYKKKKKLADEQTKNDRRSAGLAFTDLFYSRGPSQELKLLAEPPLFFRDRSNADVFSKCYCAPRSTVTKRHNALKTIGRKPYRLYYV